MKQYKTKTLAWALMFYLVVVSLLPFINVVFSPIEIDYGYALNFDGTDDYVRVPDDNSLDMTSEITILAWVRLNVIEHDHKIVHHQNQTPYRGYKLSVYAFTSPHPNNNRVELEIYNSTGGLGINRGSDGTLLEAGRWYMIGGWFNGTVLQSIVNGAFERSKSFVSDIGVSGNDLGIGVEADWSSYFCDGTVDEIQIYNRALNITEITYYYNNGVGRYTPLNTTGLVAWHHLDEGSGIVINDETSNNNHGTLYGDTDEWVVGHIPRGTIITSGVEIASPYAFTAISIMSLAMIIGIGATMVTVIQSQDFMVLISVVILSTGILISLFVSITILNGFLQI